MTIKRKILSIAAAAALAVSAFSFSGCADVSYALTVDGETIPAGVYILYSGYALSDAVSLLSEEQPDLDTTADGFDYYDQTVSGMSFGDYIKQETVNYCKRHVAVNRLFDELGITFDESEKETLNDNIDSQWDYDVSNWTSTLTYLEGFDTLGEYYQSIGIAKSSFKEVMTVSYKSGIIFRYYYGEGGIEEVSQDDIKEWIADNYSLARYFSIPITDDDGNVIESKTQLAIIENLANGYIDQLNGGEAYKDVYAEYVAYTEEQAEDEADDSDTDTDGSADDENADADDSTDDEDTDAEAGDTENAEADGSADDEDTEDADEEEDTVSDSDYDHVISVSSTSPSAEFVESLFAMDYNTAALFKADTYYYVVQRLDITDSEDYVSDYTDTALEALKGDEMEDAFKAKYADYETAENKNAPDYAAQQAENAQQGLSTITMIQYYYSYYYSLFSNY